MDIQAGAGCRPHQDEDRLMTLNWTAHALRALAIVAFCLAGSTLRSAPVTLLRTKGYEAPVRAGPDDLLLLAGSGFEETDRVVYEAEDAADRSAGHPSAVPGETTTRRG